MRVDSSNKIFSAPAGITGQAWQPTRHRLIHHQAPGLSIATRQHKTICCHIRRRYFGLVQEPGKTGPYARRGSAPSLYWTMVSITYDIASATQLLSKPAGADKQQMNVCSRLPLHKEFGGPH